MTHPSLNLAWLFSSSTNIYTHQQSIPPPPVTLPPAFTPTLILWVVIKKIEGTKQIFSQFFCLVYSVTSVHFMKNCGRFSFCFILGLVKT